ncbi:Beta-ketoacyl synthase, N-terminal domain [Chitinophaga jiangningensis]|uniref:Beta-ketoacyl synthase, N-terminal domain n=1 Tax=Chitinophaga jiangningensis TaxID=1419482 RepID=A0A1M6VUV9_9BACT|nr:beta-ketoacyl synthase chain length factor [Chitinophaga jiangningensis]SHK85240.1 Beta-ketoacyl synthase, N-terminal domain [Chitinophaga jiangningensis]
MKVKCYIQGMAAISPQQTFDGDISTAPFVHSESNRLVCVEPDYKPYIPANSLRRMTRVLRMGLATALKCLSVSGVSTPGPIVTGTGKGSLQDTEKFIKEIEQYKETALNPTPFIQSTYNSVNGLIALQQNGTDYNNTFVHRGFSFENALVDSMMLLQEGASHTLTGSFEEMTPEHYYIKSRIGQWREAPVGNTHLFDANLPGTISGEGSAFFVLAAAPTQESKAAVTGIKLLYKPASERLSAVLQELGADADLVISGANGDSNYAHYYQLLNTVLPKPTIPFKHLCGEYDTAGSFALWLAASLLHAGNIPAEWFPMVKELPADFKKVVIYNHFFGEQHTVMVVEKV